PLGPGPGAVPRAARDEAARAQPGRLGAMPRAPRPREQCDTDLPAVGGRCGRLAPPVHQAQPVVATGDDQGAAVGADEAVLVPAPPPPPAIKPPEPPELARVVGG